MKKAFLIIVIALVVLALGMNWYYTREIRKQLDRTASAVSMFGSLEYDSVRLSPSGAIHINGLAFFPRQASGQGIQIRRIALTTGSLGALLALDSEIEAGRMPPELGIRVEGFQFPLGGLPVAPGAGMRPSAPSGPADAGLGFAAAGCDGRNRFSVDDLIDMDYYLVETDIDAHYRFLEGDRRVRQTVGVRSEALGALNFESFIDGMGGTRSMPGLMQAVSRAGLDAFSIAYEDLGFYARMLEFCAVRMDMDRDEYIEHHLDAWMDRWRSLGVVPSPALVDAYGEFVRAPDSIRLRSRSEYSVELAMIGEYSLPRLLERMEVAVAFGASAPVPMELTAIDPGEAPSDSEASSGAVAAVDEAAPESRRDAGSVSATETSRRAMVERARAEAEAAAERRNEARWQSVRLDGAALAGQLGRPVRVEMRSGRNFYGRLERVEPERLHIRFIGDSGYYVRPVARAEIRGLSVRSSVP